VLRELRPVSFRLKTGPEAKYLKFGFIAQELAHVFPDLVRADPTSGIQQVVYQDMIAVLTSLMKAQETRQLSLEQKVAAQQQSLERMELLVADLQRRVAVVER